MADCYSCSNTSAEVNVCLYDRSSKKDLRTRFSEYELPANDH